MAYQDLKFTILGMAMRAFVSRASLARLAYRDVSGNFSQASRQNDEISFVYPSGGSVVNQTMKAAHDSLSSPETERVNMRLESWKKTYWDVSDADAYETGGMGYRVTAPHRGRLLAAYVEADGFRELARRGSNVTGTAGTAVFGSNADAILTARRAIKERNADMASMAWLCRPAEEEDLLGNDDFVRANTRGPQGRIAGLDGAIGRRFGFDFVTSTNIAGITEPADKSISANGSATAGALTISVDAASSADGVPAGNLLTIGGKTYAVAEGISGASGTITLNRPLEANVADNATITVGNSHGLNWAMVPDALAFGMRPTMIPGSRGRSSADIETWMDPETGFSLTLEIFRLQGGWRYQLSALYGWRLVRQEQVQRILTST